MDVWFGKFVTAMYEHQRKMKTEPASETSRMFFIQWKMTKNILPRLYTWIRTIVHRSMRLFKSEGKEDDAVNFV
jgi:hypothetical protein